MPHSKYLPERMGSAVVEPDGTTTKLNEAGPVLSAAELDSLVGAVAELATPGGWVVVAGARVQHPGSLGTAEAMLEPSGIEGECGVARVELQGGLQLTGGGLIPAVGHE